MKTMMNYRYNSEHVGCLLRQEKRVRKDVICNWKMCENRLENRKPKQTIKTECQRNAIDKNSGAPDRERTSQL